MNSITNLKANRSAFILVLLAIFVALIFPFILKGESSNKAFAESDETAGVYVNASSAGSSKSVRLTSSLNEIPETAIARIGEVYYDTLNDAFNASVDGDTVWLIKDITLNPVYNNGTYGAQFLGAKNVTFRSKAVKTHT